MKTIAPEIITGKIILTREEFQKIKEVREMFDTIMEDFDLYNNDSEDYGNLLNEFSFCNNNNIINGFIRLFTCDDEYLEVQVEIVDNEEEEE